MTVIPSQFGLLSQLLDATALRHQVIAQNVANVNTPGYRRLDVSFEAALSGQAGGQSEASEIAALRVIEGGGGAERPDGNNVDIDAEMGRLNKNTLVYTAASQILAGKIAAMRTAITGK